MYDPHKTKHPIFASSLFGALVIIIFGISLLYRSQKKKGDFDHVRGRVVYYADSFREISRPNCKYMILDGYNRVFELYVPEEKKENYVFNHKAITVADEIDIYFDENLFAADKRVSTGMQYIDKNGRSILISNDNDIDKKGGTGFITGGLLLTCLLLVLKRKGKIE